MAGCSVEGTQSQDPLLDTCRTSGDVLRNFGGRNANGVRAVYERLLKLGYGFTICASVPLIMDNFQVSNFCHFLRILKKKAEKSRTCAGALLYLHVIVTT